MSLDNIQLPPFIIQDLFKNSLVTADSGKPTTTLKKAALSYLGNNRQNIVLVLDNEEALHLPDDQLNFLLGILAACKLSMEDVAILNINKNQPVTYLTLIKTLGAEKIFLFGVSTSQIALPLQIPDYQVQAYNNQVYLSAPKLSTLQNDKIGKNQALDKSKADILPLITIMDTLIFASNNEHKVEEIRKVLENIFEIITLKEAGINIDIPEPHNTLEANASEKSNTIYRLTGKNCFSEDTGLEVETLNGEPGVKSARYAGEGRSFEANIQKLLANLEHKENRKARFRTVISLILNDREHLFEGICEGRILKEKKGESGFGYDPVFIPFGSEKAFAEMSIEEKNGFSHRKKAMEKLIDFLQPR